jgi:hypothetical protein
MVMNRAMWSSIVVIGIFCVSSLETDLWTAWWFRLKWRRYNVVKLLWRSDVACVIFPPSHYNQDTCLSMALARLLQ